MIPSTPARKKGLAIVSAYLYGSRALVALSKSWKNLVFGTKFLETRLFESLLLTPSPATSIRLPERGS